MKKTTTWMLSIAAVCTVIVSAAAPGYCLHINNFEKESKDLIGGVRDMTVYRGKIYIGSFSSGVLIYDPEKKTVTIFGGNGDLPSLKIVSLAARGDFLYIGTDSGLAVFDGEKMEVLRKIDNVTMRKTYVGVGGPGPSSYAASLYLAGGLVKNDGSGWKFLGGKGKGLFNDVNSFGFMGDRAFFGSIRGTLYEYDGETIKRATDKSLPGNVTAIHGMGETLYVGTGRGFFEIMDRTWQKVQLPGPFASASVTDIAGGEGYLILGTTEGVLKYGGKKPEALTMRDGLPSKTVYSVAELSGSVYVGTSKGLTEIKGW